eukprot:s1530_g1.t1
MCYQESQHVLKDAYLHRSSTAQQLHGVGTIVLRSFNDSWMKDSKVCRLNDEVLHAFDHLGHKEIGELAPKDLELEEACHFQGHVGHYGRDQVRRTRRQCLQKVADKAWTG